VNLLLKLCTEQTEYLLIQTYMFIQSQTFTHAAN